MMITSFCVNLVAMSVMWGFEAIVREAQKSYPPSPPPPPLPLSKPQKALFEGGIRQILVMSDGSSQYEFLFGFLFHFDFVFGF